MRIDTLPRRVAPETLDALPEDDPRAIRSRHDLRRVHRAMGTRSIVLRALRTMPAMRPDARPLRVLELGAGDGTLMLGVARALAPALPAVELTVLDRQSLIERATIESYAAVGWTVSAQVIDVLDWAAAAVDPFLAEHGPMRRWDLIVANLFVHHFEGAGLVALLRACAARSDRFFACEPRRAWFALAGSHLIGALAANAVTRVDAVLSVHAGFRGREIATLWPTRAGEWQMQEYSAGLFSHCFRAERSEVLRCAPNSTS